MVLTILQWVLQPSFSNHLKTNRVKSNMNIRFFFFFEKHFLAILFTIRDFYQKSAERKSPKNIYSYFISLGMSDLIAVRLLEFILNFSNDQSYNDEYLKGNKYYSNWFLGFFNWIISGQHNFAVHQDCTKSPPVG